MVVCYIGAGSNLGDRRKHIKRALQMIASLKGTRVVKSSRIIESDAVGGPKDNPRFLNAAIKVETKLTPLELLSALKRIERDLGRKKSRARWGPRVIDLDILFYSGKIVKRRDLKIPHRRVFEREFVIKPLLEVI
ncbi:2-amino-4-hydroxy-6-hydroxymethyldihydropteridine diphosphokinase [Candidatus Omnitrophota bacterium]